MYLGKGVLDHVIMLSDVFTAVYGSIEINFDISPIIHHLVTHIGSEELEKQRSS